jgi:hypothetical protein
MCLSFCGSDLSLLPGLLECTNDPPPKLAHGRKRQQQKLTNGVMLVKTNQTTYELGLVVMSVGIFYRVSLHSSFVENIFAKSGASESERE